MKKVFLLKNYHHKNQEFLNYFCENHLILTEDFNNADIVFSASTFIPIERFPNKKFIFGPHFSVFPNYVVKQFDNIHKNGIYIQPSQQSINSWKNEFGFDNLPMKAISFGVNTDKFKPCDITTRNKVIIYYKDRNPMELEYITNFLKKQNIEFKIFSYLKRYDEKEFIKYLKQCKYGIWLGCHESQGFALLETLSMNVPLLVWNVTLRKQQWSMRERYKNVKSNVTSIPYWDNTCGKYFFKQEEFIEKYNEFISKLDTYKPRQFVLNNLSFEKCSEKFKSLIN